MIIFTDTYSDSARKLQDTMRRIKSDTRIAVIKDDGFLPEGVLSPCEYFVSRQNQAPHTEKDLFFDFIDVPEFWEIRSGGRNGGIFDMGCEKASIYFTEPPENKNVHHVEWFMENGWVYKVDCYNKYGLKYASEFRDPAGKVESKVFYSDRNQEVIVEQPQNETITLLHDGKTKAFFISYLQFIDYYMNEAVPDGKCALFVQNDEQFERWGLSPELRERWEYILFKDDRLLNKYINTGGKRGYRFFEMPEGYPVNKAKGEALLLTASDEIEGINSLVSELQNVIFHIAANTQVSDKMYKLAEQRNVEIYPQISPSDLNDLWGKCDFYLDINHYREIFNAVDIAHQKNLLVLGFENTLHQKKLIAEENIFPDYACGDLIRRIKSLINQPVLMKELLEIQQRQRYAMWETIQGVTENGEV